MPERGLLAQQLLLHGGGGLLAGAHGEDDGSGTGHDVAAGQMCIRDRFKNDGKLGDEVLSGTNGAAGSDQPAQVNFTGKLSYNTVDLAKAVKAGYANESIDGSGRATWTLKYLAYERALDANKHPGVTQTASSFNFTVTVTDNGDGTLSAIVNYPAGGLAFVNTYNTCLLYTSRCV